MIMINPNLVFYIAEKIFLTLDNYLLIYVLQRIKGGKLHLTIYQLFLIIK